MCAGSRSIVSAGDLQDMFAGFLAGHFEFIFGRPALHTCDCCTGTKPVMYRLAIEGNGDFNVTAAVNVEFDASGVGVLCDPREFISRLVEIFNKYQHVVWKIMFFDKKALDGLKSQIWVEFDMLDFA